VADVPEPLSTPFTWTASDRIFKAMTLRGMTQLELIEATGLNKNTITSLLPRPSAPEPDLSKVREVTWRAIASALNVPLDYLRNGD
jgi:transcriptional regulator with XRE-family HTH domain